MSELPLLAFVAALAGLIHLASGWMKERSPWWERQGTVAHTALGIAILTCSHLVIGHLAVVYGRGEVRALEILPSDSPPGPAPVLVIDEVRDPRRRGLSHGRLTLLDLQSGAQKTRRILSGPVRYLGGGPEVLWLERQSGLEARDPRTLRVLATEKQLVRRHAVLKRGLGVHQVEPETGALLVPVEDGGTVRLAPPTLEPLRVVGAAVGADATDTRMAAGVAAVLSDGRAVRVGESVAAPIQVTPGPGPPAAASSPPAAAARLLLAADGRRALELASPPSVLLAQPAEGPGGAPRLSRLALDGKVVWTASTPAPARRARLAGQKLLVVAGAPDRLVALDAASGRQLWQHTF
jgi:hypothetical protein